MKKYNLHDIMNNAWRIFRNAKAGHGSEVIFASALKKAWNMAKAVIKEATDAAERAAEAAKRAAIEATKRKAAGVVRMHYSQYKTSTATARPLMAATTRRPRPSKS